MVGWVEWSNRTMWDAGLKSTLERKWSGASAKGNTNSVYLFFRIIQIF